MRRKSREGERGKYFVCGGRVEYLFDGEKYLEKDTEENIRRIGWRMEKEKKENIWKRKLICQQEDKEQRGEYLGLENIWSAEEKKNREGKSEKYLGDGKIVADIG